MNDVTLNSFHVSLSNIIKNLHLGHCNVQKFYNKLHKIRKKGEKLKFYNLK